MSEPRTHESAGEPAAQPERHDEQHSEELREAERAQLLPEEDAVGSDDPGGQATEILHESDERTEDPEGTRDESVQSPERD